jgi:hypothetical protein
MGRGRHARLFAVMSRGAVEAQDRLLFEEYYLPSLYDQCHGVGCVFCRHIRAGFAAQYRRHIIFGSSTYFNIQHIRLIII